MNATMNTNVATLEIPISKPIRDLSVGQSVEFEITRTPAVKTIACDLGMILKRKYRTQVDRFNDRIIVHRER